MPLKANTLQHTRVYAVFTVLCNCKSENHILSLLSLNISSKRKFLSEEKNLTA